MPLYRGQTTTMQKIQAVSSLHITTREEAIAFLRAISNINLQVADILQRENMKAVSIRNNERAKEDLKKVEKIQETPAPVVEETEEQLNFEDTEEHTKEQKETLLSKLKKANKK